MTIYYQSIKRPSFLSFIYAHCVL